MAQHKNYHWRPKKARKPRTTGMDMCTGCIAFGCDPMAMSKNFNTMKRARRDAGLCVACGKNPCQCKSSDSLPKREYGPKHMEHLAQMRIKRMNERMAMLEKKMIDGKERPRFFCPSCGRNMYRYENGYRICERCNWNEGWKVGDRTDAPGQRHFDF